MNTQYSSSQKLKGKICNLRELQFFQVGAENLQNGGGDPLMKWGVGHYPTHSGQPCDL